jgi:hypothetical protein
MLDASEAELLASRREWLIASAVREGDMLCRMKPYWRSQLKRPELSDEDRRKLEYLVNLSEDRDWRKL